jgi:hypothetical protein
MGKNGWEKTKILPVALIDLEVINVNFDTINCLRLNILD